MTKQPDDAKTAGQIAYESDADCGEWDEQDAATKDYWEEMANNIIDHWRRNVVVTQEMEDAAFDAYTSPISPTYWKMGGAIKAALGAIK